MHGVPGWHPMMQPSIKRHTKFHMYCNDGDEIMYNSLIEMQELVAFTQLGNGWALLQVNNLLTEWSLLLEGWHCNNTCTVALVHHAACVWPLKHAAVVKSLRLQWGSHEKTQSRWDQIDHGSYVLGVRIIAFMWRVGGVMEIHHHALYSYYGR